MGDNGLNIMVTGATGIAGYHTVRALLDSGHQVRAFIRNPAKAARLFDGLERRIELAEGDIGDAASVGAALHGCDGVIHCAAMVAVGRVGDAEQLIETNVAGVRNVIGAALEQGIERVVHVSSLATLFRGDGTLITESAEPRESQRPYGRSKVIAERYVRALQAEGKPVKIVYPGTIIGPDDPGLSESMNALLTFVREFIPLTTAGMQLVDARDLGVAHARIIEAAPGPARYLVGGTFLPWSDLANAIEAATGEPPRTVRFPAPVLRGLARFLDLLRRVVPVELPLTAEAAAYVTRWDPVPSSASLEEMGVSFRDVRESIVDSVRWLREAGHL